MDYTKTIDAGICNVEMKGKFTFSDHTTFKSLFELFSEDSVNTLQLDVKGVEFVDSAALALLLLALDEAKKSSKKLVIIEPQGQVQKTFNFSRFYELFDIK